MMRVSIADKVLKVVGSKVTITETFAGAGGGVQWMVHCQR